MDPQQAPLTRADLDQAVAAIIAAVRSDLAAMDAGLRAELCKLEASLRARIEASERAGAASIRDVRSELMERIDLQDLRMEQVDINIASIRTQLFGR